jgi:hypothetical protein
VCVCVCSFGTSQGIRLASAAHEAEEDSINSMTLLGTALTLPAGGPFLFKLPVFVLDWIQSWLTAKFATIAFHDDCPPEIIVKSSEQSSSNLCMSARPSIDNLNGNLRALYYVG